MPKKTTPISVTQESIDIGTVQGGLCVEEHRE